MGAANGSVIGLFKMHDGGDPADRLNLVLVAEGYRASEINQFQTDCQDFIDHLFAESPFDEEMVACGFNIYRLEVSSDESGADDPDCDGAGAGTTADTYFDASFCADGEVRRLVAGDSGLVTDTVDAWMPEWVQILVIVNHSTRGGAGGVIAWTTTGGDWKDVAIHELGHSIYGLADEYDYLTNLPGETGRDNHPGPEPDEPNVSLESDPAAVKWSAFVTAGAGAPTMSNADCTTPNNDPSPVGAGVVGTFEGADKYHCGAFRPQYRCMMRDTGDDFCVVCEDTIRTVMAEYAAPATTGDITLETMSVAFEDVPEGTSTVRPIQFAVDTCLPVTFIVTATPAAPFAVDSEPLLVSTPDGGSVRVARLWMRYTCDAAGTSHTDSVTIELVETGETWVVPLSGNCVQRPNAAVQLVLDQSGSMNDVTAEGRRKSAILQDSAKTFADVAYPETGLGANTYADDAADLMPIQAAGAVDSGAGRQALRNAADGYAPIAGGMTAIGDGVERAREKLDAVGGYDEKAMIVLTDGKETAAKYIAEVADGVIDQSVFAIGLGDGDLIEPTALNALTNSTGGYLLMTGLLTEDDTFLLQKYYLQILAGISNNDIILDPEGRLRPGAATARIPFDVAESDVEINAIALADLTPPVELALETPDGDVIDAAAALADPSVDYAKSSQSILMRTSLPLVVDGRPMLEGRWHALLKLDDEIFKKYLSALDTDSSAAATHDQGASLREHGVKYSVTVQVYSNLRLDVVLSQSGYEPGADVSLTARLFEYGGPFRGSATLTARIVDPNGVETEAVMTHEGEGLFTLATSAPIAGVYTYRVMARGRTRRERDFTREQTRTCAVWQGGDQPSDQPGTGDDGGLPGGFAELFERCCRTVTRLLTYIIFLLLIAILLLAYRLFN